MRKVSGKRAYAELLIVIACVILFSACTAQRKATEPAYTVQLDEISVLAEHTYHPSAEKIFELFHVKLELTPRLPAREVEGIATLSLRPYAYAQDSIELDAKNFEIHSVDILTEVATLPQGTDHWQDSLMKKPLKYSYDLRKLKVGLNRKYQVRESFKLVIAYTARPEGQYEKGIIEKRRGQGLYFIDPDGTDTIKPTQIWTQGEPEANSAWFPVIEATNQKYSQEIYLTVDEDFKTLSNGTLVYSTRNGDGTRTDYWSQKLPHAPYLTMIAAGEWVVVNDTWRDTVPVNYYVEKRYAPFAQDVFGNTPEMMEYYSDLLKFDYPWDKYSQIVVRDFVSGAMENTSAVTFFENLNQDRRDLLDRDYENIIAHELFHHWFGDVVTSESWANIALNESFASYGEYLWNDYKYGREEADYQLQQEMELYFYETNLSGIEPIVNYYYHTPGDMFDRHTYEKGELVLHMLRDYLGDSIFFASVTNYLRDRAYKPAELAHLRLAVEETSGKDLQWFFDQWFLRPGHPDLLITHDYNPDAGKVYVYVEQRDLKKNMKSATDKDLSVPVFKLPAEIAVYTDKDIVRKQVWLGENKYGSDTFVFDVKAKPLLVNFDDNKVLLAETTERKDIAQWYYQFFNAGGIRNRYKAMLTLTAAVDELNKDSAVDFLSATLSDQHYALRKYAFNDILPKLADDVKDQMRPRITAMALNDPHAQVRKSALAQVGKLYPDDTATMTFALSDSSYSVLAEAITQLGKYFKDKDAGALLQRLKAYEQLKSNDVTFAIGGVYADHAHADQAVFFRRSMANLGRGGRIMFMRPYSTWIENSEPAIVAAEADYLISLRPLMTDGWSKGGYKMLLTSAIKKLKAEENPSVIDTAGNIQQLIQRLTTEVEAIQQD